MVFVAFFQDKLICKWYISKNELLQYTSIFLLRYLYDMIFSIRLIVGVYIIKLNIIRKSSMLPLYYVPSNTKHCLEETFYKTMLE